MDLQLATIEDMVDELRRRKTSFVMVAVENTNRQNETDAWVAGQAETPLHVLQLCRLGAKAFRKMNDNGRARGQCDSQES